MRVKNKTSCWNILRLNLLERDGIFNGMSEVGDRFKAIGHNVVSKVVASYGFRLKENKDKGEAAGGIWHSKEEVKALERFDTLKLEFNDYWKLIFESKDEKVLNKELARDVFQHVLRLENEVNKLTIENPGMGKSLDRFHFFGDISRRNEANDIQIVDGERTRTFYQRAIDKIDGYKDKDGPWVLNALERLVHLGEVCDNRITSHGFVAFKNYVKANQGSWGREVIGRNK